jgi:aldehyde dehydrogenase (NAD+)
MLIAGRLVTASDAVFDVEFRVRCLRQLQEALTKHAEALRSVIVAETGSPVTLNRGAQLDIPVEGLGWVAGLAERYDWERDLGVASPYGIRSHRYQRREFVPARAGPARAGAGAVLGEHRPAAHRAGPPT